MCELVLERRREWGFAALLSPYFKNRWHRPPKGQFIISAVINCTKGLSRIHA